ncbi:hypothetical protein [Roseicella sp. DB1501]|uniref:hypothetical protein n=1 Tax=Roseicella sp. DB1501 TaxID=2730925 RepID=UPI001491B5FD|nr:hypothetical protein [Roseicella sp. DB1501]NOG71204.1 hypothetical protein [Roseicella sp. DB1501]
MSGKDSGKAGRGPAPTEAGQDAEADAPATGTIDSPAPPGEPQPGDLAEQAANRSGPVDISPAHPRRTRP